MSPKEKMKVIIDYAPSHADYEQIGEIKKYWHGHSKIFSEKTYDHQNDHVGLYPS